MQVSAEKSQKHLVTQLNLLHKKVEESNLILGDIEASKHRQTTENMALLQQLQELENATTMLVKFKSSLSFSQFPMNVPNWHE